MDDNGIEKVAVIDRCKFIGPSASSSQQLKEAVYISLDKSEEFHYTEVEHSHEFNETFARMQSVIHFFLYDKLKIIARGKALPSENVHMVDDPEVWNGILKDFKLDDYQGMIPMFCTGNQIIAYKGGDEGEFMGRLNHELIHRFSHFSVSLDHRSDGKTKVNANMQGYENTSTKTFQALDEFLTEITNLEIMNDYWPEMNLLKKFSISNYHPGHEFSIITMNSLLNKVAMENGRSYEEVLREFQRGKFLGSFKPFRIITESIGIDGVRMLSRLSLDNEEDYLVFAEKVGLIDVKETIENIKNRPRAKLSE
jgi:hypothetical protein